MASAWASEASCGARVTHGPPRRARRGPEAPRGGTQVRALAVGPRLAAWATMRRSFIAIFGLFFACAPTADELTGAPDHAGPGDSPGVGAPPVGAGQADAGS